MMRKSPLLANLLSAFPLLAMHLDALIHQIIQKRGMSMKKENTFITSIMSLQMKAWKGNYSTCTCTPMTRKECNFCQA